MRIPTWTLPLVAVVVLASGCITNEPDSSTQPAPTVSAADTVTETPKPVETVEEEPTPDPTVDDTKDDKAEPTPTRSKNLDLPVVVPANTIALTCVRPDRLPKLSETNGNAYPRILFNAMCGSENQNERAYFRFGQVGSDQAVECGTEYIIAGNVPSGVAWWCPKHKLLISSPASVIADHGDDEWKLMRELLIAYAQAYTDVKLNTYDLNKVACVIGRTILNLRAHKLFTTGQANSLMDDFTVILERAEAYKLSASLRNGYNDTGQC